MLMFLSLTMKNEITPQCQTCKPNDCLVYSEGFILQVTMFYADLFTRTLFFNLRNLIQGRTNENTYQLYIYQ